KDFLSRASAFGIDTETNITPTFVNRRIRTIQVGDKNEQYVIDLLAFAGSTANLVYFQGHNGVRVQQNPGLQAVVDVLRPHLESMLWLKVGANLQFDYEVVKWCLGIRMWHLHDVQIVEKVIYAGLVDFFETGFWGLEDLVARYAKLRIDKSHQQSFDLETPLTPAQVTYAGLDTRLPLAVRAGQLVTLSKDKLDWAAKIENDAIPAFGDMHINGLLLSADKWLTLLEEQRFKKSAVIAALDKVFVPVVGTKDVPAHDLVALEAAWKAETDKAARAFLRDAYMQARKAVNKARKNYDTFQGNAAINYGSNAQLLAALRKMGFGERKLPNTNDKSLKLVAEHPLWDGDKVFGSENWELLDECGVIDLIRLYRETDKLITTYGEEFLNKYVDKETGRIHSEIHQMGAETGRTSSSKPNVQNLPRDKRYRACFVARPGYKMLTMDYEGCELRILAELSGEKVWIDAFNNGWDVHSVGAEILYKKRWEDAAEEGCAYYAKHEKCGCKEHKKLRDNVKAINFGLAYGLAAKGLAEQLSISLKDAEKLIHEYKTAFPTVSNYLDNAGKESVMTLEARTICGSRRRWHKPSWDEARRIAMQRLVKDGKDVSSLSDYDINRVYKAMHGSIEREGKNSRIQGTNAYIAKLAMGCGFDPDGKPYMWHTLEPQFNALLENFVHDEFVIESPDAVAEQCFKTAGDAMSRAGGEMVKKIKMTYDGKIAD